MDGFHQQFLYSLCIIALGYFTKRRGIIQESDGESVARIVFNITLPSLIIVTFNQMNFDYSLVLLVLISFIYGVFSAFLGWLLFKNEQRNTKGLLMMIVPGFNIGLFAYPLIEGLWGKEGLTYFGMFDVGNAFIVFGLSYLLGSYYSSAENAKANVKAIAIKISKSIPLLSYIMVCTLNIVGWHLPSAVIDVADILSRANTPLSLLLLGIYLNFSFEGTYWKNIFKLLAIRYVVGLAAGIFLFLLLPFGEMFKFTLLIGFILPLSTAVLPYSVEFGYNARFTGIASSMTILLSFAIIWIIAVITG